MKRLLFISNLFPDNRSPIRGLDNAVLLRELANSLEIRVLSPRPSLYSVAVRQLEPLTADAHFQPVFIPSFYIPKFGSRWNAHLMRIALRTEFAKLIESFRPDIVLSSWLFPDGCAVSKLAQTHSLPHVLITQGSDTHHYLADSIRRRQIVAAINGSSDVICRSADLGNRLAKAGAERQKLHTVYNGTDSSVFRPQNRKEVRAQLSRPIPDDEHMLVFIGNFLPVKNPHFLLHAHATLCGRLDRSVTLFLIGGGPLESELRAEAAHLGTTDRVVFTGPLPSDQVATHLAAADALCLSSHNEGLPNVILEALACHTPIVTTDVGGISELIDRASRGYLVSPGDLDGYCDALCKTLVAEDSKQDADFDSNTFSWASTAKKYHSILKNAINSHNL